MLWLQLDVAERYLDT